MPRTWEGIPQRWDIGVRAEGEGARRRPLFECPTAPQASTAHAAELRPTLASRTGVPFAGDGHRDRPRMECLQCGRHSPKVEQGPLLRDTILGGCENSSTRATPWGRPGPRRVIYTSSTQTRRSRQLRPPLTRGMRQKSHGSRTARRWQWCDGRAAVGSPLPGSGARGP